VLVYSGHGTDLGALTATGTPRPVNVTGLALEFDRKMPGLAFECFNLGICNNIYVQMPADLDQFW
jgi:hypothetical protein